MNSEIQELQLINSNLRRDLAVAHQALRESGDKLGEATAACAVMREALEYFRCRVEHPIEHETKEIGCVVCNKIDQSLSSGCGKAFLDRMKEAEWLVEASLDCLGETCEPEWMARRDAFQKGGRL